MRNKGFTLIELMIVVAIITILAAIAIPNFTKLRERAAVKSALSSCQGLRKAIENYILVDGELVGTGDIFSTLRNSIGKVGTMYFKFSQLKGNLKRVGIDGNGTNGYSIWGVAKDSKSTVVFVSSWNKTGIADVSSTPNNWINCNSL